MWEPERFNDNKEKDVPPSPIPSEFGDLLMQRKPPCGKPDSTSGSCEKTGLPEVELPKLVSNETKKSLDELTRELQNSAKDPKSNRYDSNYAFKLTSRYHGNGNYSFILKQPNGIEIYLEQTTVEGAAKFLEPVIANIKKLREAKCKYGIDITFSVDRKGEFRYVHKDKYGGITELTQQNVGSIDQYLKPLIEEAEKKLATDRKLEDRREKARLQLIEKLEKNFRVKFSQEGETLDFRGRKVKCRGPTLDELKAFEIALYRAQPSHLLKDPVKDPSRNEQERKTNSKDLSKGPGAHSTDCKEDRGKLRFEMLAEPLEVTIPATAVRDTDRIIFQPSVRNVRTIQDDTVPYKGPGRPGYSLVTLTLHELAHNTQGRLSPHFDSLIQMDPAQAEFGRNLGFMKCLDKNSGELIWLLEARTMSNGKSHDLFRMLPSDRNFWVRCDANGKILQGAERITFEEMSQRAKCKLPTSYITNPVEVGAELLTSLRLGGASLEWLIKHPEAYKTVRELDRQDIVLAYGYAKPESPALAATVAPTVAPFSQAALAVLSLEQPRHIRNKEGHLVPNTARARREYNEFEARARKK